MCEDEEEDKKACVRSLGHNPMGFTINVCTHLIHCLKKKTVSYCFFSFEFLNKKLKRRNKEERDFPSERPELFIAMSFN